MWPNICCVEFFKQGADNTANKTIRRIRIVKLVLFFFNLALALFSLAVVVLASPTLGQWKTHQWSYAPYWALVTSGAVMFIVACFGCAVITQRNWILVTYTIFLVVTLIMQLALAGVMFNQADSMRKVIGEEMQIIFNNSAFRDGEHESTATKFYTIQQELKCCGMTGVTDYDITGSVNLPDSCCAHISGNSTCTSLNAYNVGCTVIIGAIYFDWNKTVANVVTSVVCVLGGLSVLLFVLFMDVYRGGEDRNRPLEFFEHVPRHGSTIDEYDRGEPLLSNRIEIRNDN